MSFRISSWAISRPLVPLLLMLGLLLSGIMAYSKLPVNGMPTVKIPMLTITVGLPGAVPTEIETQVAQNVENAISNISNVKHITSYLADGVSVTEVEFKLGTDIKTAMSSVRDQLTEIRAQLPKGITEPVIQRLEADTSPLMTYTLASPKQHVQDLSWLVDRQLVNSLMAVSGVAKVQRQGGADREIRVELDPSKLRAYGVSADMVSRQLRVNAMNLPAGRVNDGARETLIRVVGTPRDVSMLANLEIDLGNGRHAKLAQLGYVHDTTNEARQLSRVNHQPVVAVAIYRNAKADEVKVAAGIEEAFHAWQVNHPDVVVQNVQTQVEFTRQTYHSAICSFVEGVILAAIVVFVFLRTWRATWVAAVAIPLSIIPTFIVMQSLGFSLNLVSMLALSLVSGILVDDAIVEIENIMRHIRMGKTPFQAAMHAADEIGLAVVATSVVIIAVFVPVSFMGGVVGQYFTQFGLTVAVATFFSLVVARLITPVLAAYFLNPTTHVHQEPHWLQCYRTLLQSVLRRRALTVVAGVLILGASVMMVLWLPTDFLPPEDKAQSVLQVELPAGARLTDTDAVVRQLTDIFLQQPEVQTVYSWVGGKDTETNLDGQVRRATLTVRLVPASERQFGLQAFERSMLSKLSAVPNVRISFLNENGGKALSLVLNSDNPDLLRSTALQLEHEMRAIPQLRNVISTVPLPQNNLTIVPRPHDAARLGVTTEAISDAIRVGTMGELDSNLPRLNLDGHVVPVRVMLDPASRTNMQLIQQLQVQASNGRMVPLKAVADFSLGAGPTSITRFDRKRQIMLEADLHGVSLGEALSLVDALPTMQKLPEGVYRYDTGDSEMLSEMFDSFSMAMIAGVLVVFVVLVVLFHTVLQPITIMISLPLSIGGALLALLLTQSTLSLPSVIGILMLMGIVGKNGILLVDFMIEQRALGMNREAAIIQACMQRANPILMTTLAMIAGMLPVIFGIGAGTAFRVPMAFAVIGGLLTSTALSLLFVPVVYSLMDDFEVWLTPKLSKFTTLTPQDQAS